MKEATLNKAQKDARKLTQRLRYEGSLLKQVRDTAVMYRSFFGAIVRALYHLVPLTAVAVLIVMGAHVGMSGRADPQLFDKLSQIITGSFMMAAGMYMLHKVIVWGARHEDKS